MTTNTTQLREHLQAFDFNNLFVSGLGWNHYHGNSLQISIEGFDFELESVAEKAGFAVYTCAPGVDGSIPEYPIRRKIERQVAQRVFEHLIIFVDEAHTAQIWQWVKRETGKPAACREIPYRAGQSGTSLLQRIGEIAVSLEEELQGGIGITEVVSRVRRALDIERVTKRFYDRFRSELTAFQSFIEGMARQGDREWYASLMLNRMMFIYFIQKQGFLDDDTEYLRHRLEMVQVQAGEGHYQQFYRIFLRRLFFEGLGQPETERQPELVHLLGRVPFLNGGLFDVHDLERENPDINIPDEAFVKVFNFFDAYQWHLDDRPNRDDNEINPDVLGYIFEKYINQKQMGAYYTKEDITGYITRNTVIPFLFDSAEKKCPVAFQHEGGVWRLLEDDPERYIFPANGHGIAWNYSAEVDPERLPTALHLPDDIAVGIADVSLRQGWNVPAPYEYALPSETWREVVARRKRYEEVRAKLAAGEVQSISDLITLNLDIERFAKDVITQSEGPELLRAFWQSLTGVSVLDPTCGSGAFLFAALNMLEPLYTACLEGMQGFLQDLEVSQRPHQQNALSDFRQVIDEIRQRSGDNESYGGESEERRQRYFILKSIVLNNLYGVDIMEEATEICKLRLFLRLVAQLETYDQIEPLPDIDFNIRAGNALVGFTSLESVRNAMTVTPDGQSRMLSDEDNAALDSINKEAKIAACTFDEFRNQQTALRGRVPSEHKTELRRRLDRLRGILDRHLATEYGIQSNNGYGAWRASHHPFHWFVEFYGVMQGGGFDVIVGNPPYVEYRTIRTEYTVKGYVTERCGNLYAMTWERSIELASDGRVGLIVPVSALCADGYASLRELLITSGEMIISNFNDRPSRLFDGIEHNRLCIILLNKDSQMRRSYSSAYIKWRSDERDTLFQQLTFVETGQSGSVSALPKLGQSIEASILGKFNEAPIVSEQITERLEQFPIYYTRKLSSFVQILDFVPKIYDSSGNLRKPSELKEIRLNEGATRDGILALLNSSLFYWLVTVFSDCRNLNKREIEMIRFDLKDEQTIACLSPIALELMEDIRANSQLRDSNYRKLGTLRIQSTYPRMSKPIIDKIDRVLAEHYGFTDEELDYIINYDIKYRMGLEGRT